MAEFRWTNRSLLTDIAEKAASMVAVDVLSVATGIAPQRTGTLARSIVSARASGTPTRVTYQVGTDVFYAPFVEFGTRHMAAQPYLGPAIEQARRKYGAR